MIVRNHCIVSGNLSADPEITHTHPTGGMVVRFSIANNELEIDRDSKETKPGHTNWLPVTVFNGLAKRVLVGLKKGDLVTAFGAIRTRSYTDKSGKSARSFEIIATDVLKSSLLPAADEKPTDFPSFEDFKEGQVSISV